MANTVSKVYTDLQPEEWNSLPVLAQRIRLLLEKNNMTARQLSIKTNISPSVIKAYIETKNDIGICNLQKLADAFSVTTDYLLGRSDLPSENPTAEAASKYTGLSQAACQRLHEIYTCVNHLDLSRYKDADIRVEGEQVIIGKVFIDGEPVALEDDGKDNIDIRDISLPLSKAIEYMLLKEDFSFISSLILHDSFIGLALSVKDYKNCLKRAAECIDEYLSMFHNEKWKKTVPFAIGAMNDVYSSAQTEERDARIQILDVQESIKDIINDYAADEVKSFREKCKKCDISSNI